MLFPLVLRSPLVAARLLRGGRTLVVGVLLLCAGSSAWAQAVGSRRPVRRDSLQRKLQAQGVPAICFYTAGCTGCRDGVPTPCAGDTPMDPTFAFWQQQGRTYRLYLGDCRLAPAQVITTTLWPYLHRHQRALQREEIRPFHQRHFPFPQRVYHNHGGWQEVEILLPRDTIRQDLDAFDVAPATRAFGKQGGRRNIYYRRNRRTHVYQLFQLLQAAAEAPAILPAADAK